MVSLGVAISLSHLDVSDNCPCLSGPLWCRSWQKLECDVRHLIKFYYEQDLNFNQIAALLGIDWHSVKRWADEEGCKDKPRSGRPRKLTDEHVKFLVDHCKNRRRASTRIVAKQFSQRYFSVGRSTVQRRLWEQGLHPYKMQRRPHITPDKARQRVQAARHFGKLKVEDLVFADEASFNGYAVLNRHNDVIWAESPEDVPFDETVKYPPFIKACLFMSRKRVGKPYFYKGTITASQYQEALICSELVDKPRSFVQFGKPILLHDGASAHNARSTQRFMDEHGIRHFSKEDWPANSPDLNVIENLLGHLGWEVSQRPRRSVKEVRASLLEALASTKRDYLKSLCDSFPKRCRIVIDARGAYTKYY